MGETKVNDGKFLLVVLQVLLGERLVVRVNQAEVSSDQGLASPLLFGFSTSPFPL